MANHPRRVFHFTPTSASRLNAVEGFFSVIMRRRIPHGVFKSAAELDVFLPAIFNRAFKGEL